MPDRIAWNLKRARVAVNSTSLWASRRRDPRRRQGRHPPRRLHMAQQPLHIRRSARFMGGSMLTETVRQSPL